MATIKTDNSWLEVKARLRVENLPENPVVLDAYEGEGLIWKRVENLTGHSIKRLGIEKKKIKGFHLPGDNMSYLNSLDLSFYNVIDLDAYGVPYKQLKVLFERGYRGCVFITFIQSLYGGMPQGMMLEVGFSRDMLKSLRP